MQSSCNLAFRRPRRLLTNAERFTTGAPHRSPRFFTLSALFLALLTTPASIGRGEVLDHLPDEALGFISVRNVESVSDKTSSLLSLFGLNFPAPLKVIEQVTGIGDGIEREGDLLIALLPGDHDKTPPHPLMLLPVSDYAKFAKALGGDPSGAVCRVSVAGEDVLCAKDGSYATLTNIEHRSIMTQLLDSGPTAVSELRPLHNWLTETDICVVLMSRGLATALRYGSAEIDDQRGALAAEPADPALMEVFADAREALKATQATLNLLETEFEAVALGFDVDQFENLKISHRAILRPSARLAKLSKLAGAAPSSLKGFPAGPFVASGTFTVADDWVELFAQIDRRLTESFPETFDMPGINEEGLEIIEQSTRAALAGVKSVSWIVRQPSDNAQIIDGIFASLVVDHAGDYLESLKKSFELDNQVTALPDAEMPFQWQIEPCSIADAKGYSFSVNLTEAAADPNVPQWEGIIQRFCGDDGQVHIYAVAIDSSTVLIAIESLEDLPNQVERIRQDEPGFGQQPSVADSYELLSRDAGFTLLVSPHGYTKLINKSLEAFFLQFGGVAAGAKLPEIKAASPIGVAFDISEGQITLDVVCPRQTLEALAEYIQAAE